MTNFYQKMLNLEEALTSADLDTLNKIIIYWHKKSKSYVQTSITDIILSDEDIFSI